MDDIIQSWIQEHVEKREGKGGDEKDFIDVMLSKIDDGGSHGHSKDAIIKATALGLILAGSDTTSLNLTWVIAILLDNRPALNRAREEIDTQIGKTRWVEDSDIKKLVYLQAIIKETLRLYPPGPLSFPHQSTEDCEIGGYHIPKGTRLLPNLWKLHRDPRIWTDPEKFVPERWLEGNHAAGFDVSGINYEFEPFGSGRRSCPGTTFATQVTHLTLARLIQGFEFATPGNERMDMSEGLGITLPKVKPIEVLITPRLASDLYEG
jgi:cytochrome P450